MKKILVASVALVALFSLTGCKNDITKQSSSNSTSEAKTSTTKITQEEGEELLIALVDDMQSGKISQAEFKKKRKEIEAKTETVNSMIKRTQDSVSTFDGIPTWAKQIGAVEPEGLKIITERSSVTQRDGDIPESFIVEYTGNADELMTKGRKLANDLGLEISDYGKTFNASGKLGENHFVNITVRTDVDLPFLSYNIAGEYTGETIPKK